MLDEQLPRNQDVIPTDFSPTVNFFYKEDNANKIWISVIQENYTNTLYLIAVLLEFIFIHKVRMHCKENF